MGIGWFTISVGIFMSVTVSVLTSLKWKTAAVVSGRDRVKFELKQNNNDNDNQNK